MTLSATNLWRSDGQWPRLYRGSLRGTGRVLVTDRRIVLYANELLLDDETIPVPEIRPVRSIAAALAMPVLPDPSGVVFRGSTLDLLERAGYRVRPLLDRRVKAHGIVRDGRVVGLLMPMRPDSIAAALGDRTAR